MYFRTYNAIGIALLCAGLLAGCGGDGTPAAPPGDGVPAVPPKVVATLQGIITAGRANAAMAGVAVSAAGQSTITDAGGNYTLSINNPGDSTVVLAKKDGYLSMSKQAAIHAGVTTTQNITLQPEDVRTTFAATQGAVVVVNGAVIDIPANAIQDASGAPYGGAVTLAASYRNPTTADGVDAFPQPYQGLDGESTGTLQTVGVIEAKLLDSSGQPLQLSQNATLTFPGVSAVDNGAASIPLWYYDEARAIWVHQGDAQRLVDGSYQGQVAHFTQWNLDVFNGGGASITACIQFQNGAAARWGIDMTLLGPGVMHPVFYGQSVQAGNLEIVNAPADAAMMLTILDAGTGLITSVPVPPVPYGGNVTLPCQTLVGTDAYAPPADTPEPAPVAPDAPASVFAGNYDLKFNGSAVDPWGTFSIDVTAGPGGVMAGAGIAYDPTHAGYSWGLAISGQVVAGGYVTMTATPVDTLGLGLPPYASIGFTGKFPQLVPNYGPGGTWVENGDTGSGSSPNRLFGPPGFDLDCYVHQELAGLGSCLYMPPPPLVLPPPPQSQP